MKYIKNWNRPLSFLCIIWIISICFVASSAYAEKANIIVLPDADFIPKRLSANGQALIGVKQVNNDKPESYLWRADKGYVKLIDAPDKDVAIAEAISEEGSVVVGRIRSWSDSEPDRLFIWTEKDGGKVLPYFSRYRDERIARMALTSDGKTAYFVTQQVFDSDHKNVLRSWSAPSDYRTLSLGDNALVGPISVSGDGTGILAVVRSSYGDRMLARIVNEREIRLVKLSEEAQSASGMDLSTNRRGTFTTLWLLNDLVSTSMENVTAVFDSSLKPVTLPSLNECSKPRAWAADGQGAIFGDLRCSNQRVPVRWTSSGPEPLAQWLSRTGVMLAAWSKVTVDEVSDDGRTILGTGAFNGKRRYFLARIEETACATRNDKNCTGY
jgi:hypothetical protein